MEGLFLLFCIIVFMFIIGPVILYFNKMPWTFSNFVQFLYPLGLITIFWALAFNSFIAIAISLLGFVFAGLYPIYEDKQVERKAKAARVDVQMLNHEKRQAFLRDIMVPCLVIDSNIWMDHAFESFFIELKAFCQTSRYQLIMLGPQFDEIDNIKARSSYNKDQNKAARVAISRIEDFQKSGVLRIDSVKLNSAPGSYADPVIIKVLLASCMKGEKSVFITNDKTLRIRVREILSARSEAAWAVVEGESIFELFPLWTPEY